MGLMGVLNNGKYQCLTMTYLFEQVFRFVGGNDWKVDGPVRTSVNMVATGQGSDDFLRSRPRIKSQLYVTGAQNKV